MIDSTQAVTFQQAMGTTFVSIVLLLVVMLAIVVYFSVRVKLLNSRIANLEYALKVVAEKAGVTHSTRSPAGSP